MAVEPAYHWWPSQLLGTWCVLRKLMMNTTTITVVYSVRTTSQAFHKVFMCTVSFNFLPKPHEDSYDYYLLPFIDEIKCIMRAALIIKNRHPTWTSLCKEANLIWRYWTISPEPRTEIRLSLQNSHKPELWCCHFSCSLSLHMIVSGHWLHPSVSPLASFLHRIQKNLWTLHIIA